MQFRLFSFALIVLNCVDYSHCQTQQSHRWRRNKRDVSSTSTKPSYGAYPICKGCSVCSKDNGCMNCQPKLFLFLRRERMRQYGECLHACPSGYYGMRGTEINMCSRCRIDNCEACFSKDFCTKCKPGFYLHKGHCFEKCPEGFAPLEDSMECGEGCEVGQWSEWGTCARRNKTCGFKWGLETRTRHIVKKPPKDTIPCPTIAESRRCKMAMRHCRRGGSGKGHRTKEPKKKSNKQRLRFRAQNQHSDHLASIRAGQ
ncbi:R-spondin-2 isoform X1 [Pimephales promelas]|uniref:R-spondin-2 isoform X1 n=1 Tax=Pimephales promelas TaxID=90988 RepID=UPI0019555EC2|nr:R-spondin-2 isoform X1 [Pimephales promelas]KAG1936468.1 R-spondin-2 [Pimephales promelas]